MRKTPRITQIVAATILAAVSAPVAAESSDENNFSLSLGVFITDRDTDTRLDGSIGDGTPLNLERDLGLDSSDNVFRVDGYYKFNERHRIDFSVFDLSRDASKPITSDIQWGDELFTIDTVVETDVSLEIYKAAYTYSFYRRDKGYLGATAGLYVADTRASLSEQTLGTAEVGDITAPLPVIGLRGEYAFNDKWSFRASGEFFFVEYEGVEGSLVDLYAGLDYRVLDNLSIGAGFNTVTIDVDTSESRFEGAIDWEYSGGLIFFKFDF